MPDADEPQHVERADQVDLDDLAERLEVVRRAVAVDRALGPTDAGAVDATCAAARSRSRRRPRPAPRSSSVTSALRERAVELLGDGFALGRVAVDDDDVGALGGEAPAVASPMPEAPPVTSAVVLVRSRSIRRTLVARTVVSRRLAVATVRGMAAAFVLPGFSGQLFHPGDTAYDEARAVFNGMVDRKPALIARCASADDVVLAVNLARAGPAALGLRRRPRRHRVRRWSTRVSASTCAA